jgi:hypothetical protein
LHKSTASRRRPANRDQHLKELMKEAVREVLKEEFATQGASTLPIGREFDWLEAAHQLRNRMPMTADSTPLLRSLREERARR